MYDEQDLLETKDSVRKAALIIWIPAAILLAGVVWSFIVRIKWLTILLSILAGFWIIFSHQNVYVPRRAYLEHVTHALHGRRKETEGQFLRMEKTPVEREDVLYYAFYLNIGEKQAPEDDRLFYYDARKPLPAWQLGDRLRIVSYDKFVAGYTELGGA